jgi:hypothetical protein
MKMLQRHFRMAGILLTTLVVIACATTPMNDSSKTGMVIQRMDSERGGVRLYIDGESLDDSLKAGASVGITLANGKHTVYATYHDQVTTPVSFNVRNDQHYFAVVAFDGGSASLTLYEEQVVPVAPNAKSAVEQNTLTDQAISKSFATLSANLPDKTAIAIVNIAAQDADTGLYVIDELTVLFVNSKKYSIVDRKSLDVIRTEQNFQMTGEVDDASAVSIGFLSGAQLVITGTLTGEGERRRLRLKALDVKTAEIIAMSSEAL